MRKPKRSLVLLGVIVLTIGGIFFASSATANKTTAPAEEARILAGFMIASDMNNRCLEVRDGNPGNGVLVGMWDCGGWPSERWSWTGDTLRSDVSGRCLDIAATNADNGAAVNMFDCFGGDQQRWYWNGHELRSRLNNRCLSIANSNWWSGAAVIMWDCVGTANQRWHTA